MRTLVGSKEIQNGMHSKVYHLIGNTHPLKIWYGEIVTITKGIKSWVETLN